LGGGGGDCLFSVCEGNKTEKSGTNTNRSSPREKKYALILYASGGGKEKKVCVDSQSKEKRGGERGLSPPTLQGKTRGVYKFPSLVRGG